MSLVGNLEDLGLGDILQIVSLSRKSGVLYVTNGAREGKIVFRDGQVIRAFSTDVEEDLESIVAGSAVVSPQQLLEGLALFKEKGKEVPLDAILREKFGIAPDAFDEVKKRQIEEAAYSLFGWVSGNFNFELKDASECLDKGDFFVYGHGLNPQFLAMEGTRLQDELKRDRAAGIERAPKKAEKPAPVEAAPVDDPFAGLDFEPEDEETTGEQIKAFHEETVVEQTPPPAPPEPSIPAVVAKGGGRAVLLIDDDPNVLKAMKEKFEAQGFQAVAKMKTEDALHSLSELQSSGARMAVVADLIMPRMDGTGMLGGVETLEIIRGGFPHVPVVIITDHSNREAEAKSKELGAAGYLDKPKRAQFGSEFDAASVGAFLDGLTAAVSPLFEAGAEKKGEKKPEKKPEKKGETSGLFDLGADLREEVAAVGQILPEEGTGPRIQPSPGISMLKSMIEELNGPEGGRQITLLTLRFASELMNRAVIFLVKNDAFEGLGQFGIEIEGEIADKRVRATKIPKDIPSILKEVVDSQRSVTKPLEKNEGNSYMVERLGGQQPFESFAAPIIANGRVAVIVYCDNVPADKPIGDVSALDIFLMQAGIAMERALLERRVGEMGARQ